MTGSGTGGPDVPGPGSSDPWEGHRAGVLAVVVSVLLLGVSALLLVWMAQGSYRVTETYGGLGGGWGQLLGVLALSVGLVVGVCLIVVARLLGRDMPARWLIVCGVALALLTASVGACLGSQAHSAASARSQDACDEPVGGALVSLAQELEPGPLVLRNGQWTGGRDDGRCVVLVNIGPGADVDAEIARVAAAAGWSRTDDGWLGPDGVSMTYQTVREPDTMTVVDLLGHG